MRALLVGISLVALAGASGCTTAQVRAEANPGVAVHRCTKKTLLRPVGLFGGTQPEIFLSGPDLRSESPPVADGLTRVLDVTEVDYISDPGAEPVIDKCRSWLQSMGEDEIELTIMWRDRNCPDWFDQDDSRDCRSRASFKFSPEDLGIREILDDVEDVDDALQRLLVVDAYFTREIHPTGRQSATGMANSPRGSVHLVVRVIRASRAADSRGSEDHETPPASRIDDRERSGLLASGRAAAPLF